MLSVSKLSSKRSHKEECGMKNRFINHTGISLFIHVIFAGCASEAQKRVDIRFPRQEQALVVPGGDFGVIIITSNQGPMRTDFAVEKKSLP
jgi:hypothetical protein